ncbi:MAG: LamG-like jellyroll fold domain-containing protein, partial [Planctomycetota bacterium]
MLPTAVRVPAFVISLMLLLFTSAAARAELKFHCAFDGNRMVDRGASPAAEIVLNDDAYLTEETPGELSCYALDASFAYAYSVYAETVGDADKIDALNEMTVTFWLNMYHHPQEGDCLISDAEPYPPYPPAGVGGWEIAVAGVGGQDPTADNFALTFGIFESMGSYMTEGVAMSPAIDAWRQWVFVAVTYNAAYHQRFYLGDEISAPAQIGNITLFGDPLPDNSAPLRINGASYHPLEDRSPPTHIDDVRIYDTALGVAQLDAIRLENIEDPYDPNAVPSFYGIRGYPGDGCRSAAEGVSDDGSFVVGGTSVGYDHIAFRWQGGVMTPLGDLPGGIASSTAFDVSSDGSVVVGESDSSNATWEAFRWEDGTMSP